MGNTEPILSISNTGVLLILGLATGLDPRLMFAGLCGGLWSLIYLRGLSVPGAAVHVLLSAGIAAYLAPWVSSWKVVQALLDHGDISEMIEYSRYGIALVLGLVAVPALGKVLLRRTAQSGEQ